MTKIAIYSGLGAVLFYDVKSALEKLDFSYSLINEKEIIKSELNEYETLIIPGGDTKEIWRSLYKNGFDKIREFIRKGGKYIGICAGAYLAPKTVKLRFGETKKGLGIINVENKRRYGIGLKEIEFNESHPISKGYKGKIKIWYQNGPYILADKGVEIVAKYNLKFSAIVSSKYEKGKVILFSCHPEGSIEYEIDPEKLGTLNLLKNAIKF